ncbi:MAG: adenylate kinase [Chloroflexi bacterium]|nr:adenylate kinase [Chloroflexota bacterium]MDA1296451.1 adenylate kinase [Chloroflexota bacterium]
MRIVLFGPPGAGKGTQGLRLAGKLRIVHLATGDMLRAEVAAASDLGRKARDYMDRGDLVPDDVIIGMIKSRLKDVDGMVLDGFPRTLAQAEALDAVLDDAGLPLDRAVLFRVAQEELVKRLVSRAVEQGRSDDTPETVSRRMDVYREQTAPVIDYYRSSGRVVEIDGTGSPDEVFDRLESAVTGQVAS